MGDDYSALPDPPWLAGPDEHYYGSPPEEPPMTPDEMIESAADGSSRPAPLTPRHLLCPACGPRVHLGGRLCPGCLEELPASAGERRAVACVNACAGIPTEVLEQLVAGSCTDAARLAWLSLEAQSAMRSASAEGR